MLWRMIRASVLDPSLYEEVERDADATAQATMVVVLTAVAAGIGGILRGSIAGLIAGIVGGIIGWAVFALLTYWIGTTIFKGPQTEATWGQLLRTTGFAQSPAVLRVLGFLPVFGIIINIAVFLWVIVAVVIAVRQALDFSTGNAVLTCLAGWVVQFVVSIVVGGILFAVL